MKEILDSRFFAALFFPQNLATKDAALKKLRQLRRQGRGILPSIVIAEVANIICREGGRELALAHIRSMEASGLTIVPLDGEIAADAGLLRCTYRAMPLADLVIAAIAFRDDGRVISDDPHFREIRGLRVAWIT